MNALTKFWTDEDKLNVSKMLEKIFILNDRNADSEKISLYSNELSKCGYQVYDVIKELDEMCREEMKNIRVPEIIKRIRLKKEEKRIEENKQEKIWCEKCNSTGHITMYNNTYGYAFGCICENGSRFSASYKAPQWNGEKEMEHRKEIYSLTIDNV